MSVDVSILIVTYHCRGDALECLRSIESSSEEVSHEIIVLDNASQDGTVELVRERFPQVRLLALDRNVGFARGVNRAAREAQGEYLLLLNPDVVVHSGTVTRLVEFARRSPQHGIYGGRTLSPDGSVHPASCWGLPTLWSQFCFATMLSTVFRRSRLFDPESLGRWQRDSEREVGFVTGCLLLIRRSLWDELGGFDPRFFMYGEETDLALRAYALGYRPAITPNAVITHEIGVSTPDDAKRMASVLRAKTTLFRKHWPGWRGRTAVRLLLAGVALRAGLARVAGLGKEAAGGKWRGVWADRAGWESGYGDPDDEAEPVGPPSGAHALEDLAPAVPMTRR
jgi:N-acetylglucosaminyl-diphospho-decaprenol L-rhamnosyltransferase